MIRGLNKHSICSKRGQLYGRNHKKKKTLSYIHVNSPSEWSEGAPWQWFFFQFKENKTLTLTCILSIIVQTIALRMLKAEKKNLKWR